VEWVVSGHEDVTLRVSVVVMLTLVAYLSTTFNSWLHIRYDYLLNLSILISRGKKPTGILLVMANEVSKAQT
jgi:hypothetical protein